MVFDATFNNISVISWWSILMVEETEVPGENHRPVASHWQTLSHNVVSKYHKCGCQLAMVFRHSEIDMCCSFTVHCIIIKYDDFIVLMDFLCWMPFSAVYQLSIGDQFYYWRRVDCSEKTTDLSQVTYIYLIKSCIKCTSP